MTDDGLLVEFVVVATIFAILSWASVAFGATVIRGGEVRPVTGDPIEEGVVVIGGDGRIREVGGPDLEVPDEAEVVDAEGGVVTPGFIDARTRLGLVEVWAASRTRDFNRGGGTRIRAAFRTADGFNPASAAISVARTGGVTSSVVVPGGGLIAGRSAWVDLVEQEHDDATVVDPAAGMHVNLTARRPNDGGGIRSRGGLFELLREVYDDLGYFRNHRDAYDENRMREVDASRLDLEALEPTVTGDLPVVVNVHRAADIDRALEFADREGLDIVLTGAVEAWTRAEKLAERDVPVVVDPTVNLPTRFETLGARMDNAAMLAEAGVPVVLSTFGVHRVATLRQLAGNAVRAGMSREDALEAITSTPAQTFGRGDDYGALERGHYANVAVWSGDPFEFSSGLEAVFVRGERVSLETRQDRLFERYRELDRRGPPAPKERQSGKTDGS